MITFVPFIVGVLRRFPKCLSEWLKALEIRAIKEGIQTISLLNIARSTGLLISRKSTFTVGGKKSICNNTTNNNNVKKKNCITVFLLL